MPLNMFKILFHDCLVVQKRISRVYSESGLLLTIVRLGKVACRKLTRVRKDVRINFSPYRVLNPMPESYPLDERRGGTAAFTIVSKNYMHYALTLRNSFLKHNPGCRFTIFLMDMLENDEQVNMFRSISEMNVEVLNFLELKNGISSDKKIEEMLFKYTILEMNTAIKPYVIEYLLRDGHDKVLYIDPDIMFYSSIDDLDIKLNYNDVILTPHILEPYADDKRPSEIDIMMGGTYNLGFIAVRKSSNVFKLLTWWQDRLFDRGYSDINNGMFTDQKWVDLIPSLFEKVCVYKNPGYNVAYWNLHERQLVHDGVWKVNEKQLVFFHFSGMSLDNISGISKHQDRFTLYKLPCLRPLLEGYRDVVRQYSPDTFATYDYYFSKFSGGAVKFPDFVRRNTAGELASMCVNPFLACNDAKEKVISYYKQDVSGDGLVTRFSLAMWNERPDLQLAFPDIIKNEVGRHNYHNWGASGGGDSYAIGKSICQGSGLVVEDECTDVGLNVVGYIENILGVAEAARLFFNKSLAANIPVTLFPISDDIHSKQTPREIENYSPYYAVTPGFKRNVHFVNADEIRNVRDFYPHLFDGKYNAAVWWWEFEDYFDFPDAFECVDEVLVFTDFVAKAINKSAPKNVKITKMTYPFMRNWELTVADNDVRKTVGFTNKDFIFLYVFDLHSGFERKNPLALIDAFELVSRLYDNAKLIIKVGHSEHFNAEYKSIQRRIEQCFLEDKVVLIIEPLTRNHLMSLVNAADAYVSLHRSEGLGLGMLEAMYVGKPVVATSYGGNLEFMNNDNSLLVEYDMVELAHDFGPYKMGWLWANPHVNHAADQMIKLISDANFCSELGKKGQRSVLEQYNRKNFINELYDFVA